MQTLGKIEHIWRYPVKSLAPQALERTAVGLDGLPDDRVTAMLVEGGHARTGKPYRGKEHELYHTIERAQTAQEYARQRGVTVVEAPPARYFDAAPVSLLFDTWLRKIGALVGYELEPLRFRPNFFAVAEPDFDEPETALVGAELQIGSVRMRVRKPIGRCVVPSYDLQSGVSDPAVVREIAQQLENFMGIYCDVVEPGEASRGDAVVRLS